VSLRLRLGLWYGGLTGLVVLLVSLFTYAVHSRTHYDELDQALVGAAVHLAGESSVASAGQAPPRLLAVPIAPDLVVRIYGRSDRLVDQTPRTSSAPAVDPRLIQARGSAPAADPVARLAPSAVAVHPGPGTFGLATGADGVRWRVLIYPIGHTGERLALVASLDHLDAAIAGVSGRHRSRRSTRCKGHQSADRPLVQPASAQNTWW
jgi:hypothetical protein